MMLALPVGWAIGACMLMALLLAAVALATARAVWRGGR